MVGSEGFLHCFPWKLIPISRGPTADYRARGRREVPTKTTAARPRPTSRRRPTRSAAAPSTARARVWAATLTLTLRASPAPRGRRAAVRWVWRAWRKAGVRVSRAVQPPRPTARSSPSSASFRPVPQTEQWPKETATTAVATTAGGGATLRDRHTKRSWWRRGWCTGTSTPWAHLGSGVAHRAVHSGAGPSCRLSSGCVELQPDIGPASLVATFVRFLVFLKTRSLPCCGPRGWTSRGGPAREATGVCTSVHLTADCAGASFGCATPALQLGSVVQFHWIFPLSFLSCVPVSSIVLYAVIYLLFFSSE
ncbi:unnamed protein product [Ixodes pacificus]